MGLFFCCWYFRGCDSLAESNWRETEIDRHYIIKIQRSSYESDFLRYGHTIFIYVSEKNKCGESKMWIFKLIFFFLQFLFYFIFTTNLRLSVQGLFLEKKKRGKIFFWKIPQYKMLLFRIPYFIFENDILHQRSKAVK